MPSKTLSKIIWFWEGNCEPLAKIDFMTSSDLYSHTTMSRYASSVIDNETNEFRVSCLQIRTIEWSFFLRPPHPLSIGSCVCFNSAFDTPAACIQNVLSLERIIHCYFEVDYQIEWNVGSTTPVLKNASCIETNHYLPAVEDYSCIDEIKRPL